MIRIKFSNVNGKEALNKDIEYYQLRILILNQWKVLAEAIQGESYL